MKTRFSIFLFLAACTAVMISFYTFTSAQAQCVDAAGGPIPCPSGGGDNDNKKRPTDTAVPPTATSTPLPISNPADDGTTEVKWSGTCGGVNKNTPCTDKLINACNAAGGTPDASFDDEADTTTITCTLPSILEPTSMPVSSGPTPTPAPRKDGFLGQCSKADGDFFKCAEQFTCEDGLLVIEVDLYSGNGTVYDFYCYPNKPTFPPSGWWAWVLGGIVIGIGGTVVGKALNRRVEVKLSK